MTWQTVALILLGGGLGAAIRYLVSMRVRLRFAGQLTWGTLIVNAVGSAVLGVAVANAHHFQATPLAVLTLGFLGGLTTFSTAMLESARLLDDGHQAVAWWYALSMAGICLACAGFGYFISGLI